MSHGFFADWCTVTQTVNLLWTAKDVSSGIVEVKGIQGDPAVWVKNGLTTYTVLNFADQVTQQKNRRVALGFDFNRRDIMFTDRGLKNVYRVRLPVSNDKLYFITMFIIHYTETQ